MGDRSSVSRGRQRETPEAPSHCRQFIALARLRHSNRHEGRVPEIMELLRSGGAEGASGVMQLDGPVVRASARYNDAGDDQVNGLLR